MNKIAIFGGSFNPPGIHHRMIIESILSTKLVDFVMVIPCGSRPDKDYIEAEHRKELVLRAFDGIRNCTVNALNLELQCFTSNYRYEAIFSALGQLWHVVGSDQLVGASSGQSIIHRKWEKGAWVYANLKFIIIRRPGFALESDDMPPHSVIMDEISSSNSTDIKKDLLSKGSSVSLAPRVLEYIRDKSLFV